jgi:hypothetical protein
MHDEITQQLPLGESFEVARGVTVERRSFVTTAAALFAAANLPGLASARKLDPRRDSMSYEDFLREVLPIAKRLVADTSLRGQDLYLHAVAACAVKLGEVPVPDMRSSGEGTSIGANDGGDPFVVLHWRMQPGSKIGVHPHIYGNVCTLGLEGEARIANYEVVGARDYDAKEPFVVRRTVDQWLTPGAINLVNLDRNYMHGFVAGTAGARGLDITTRIREKRSTPNLVLGKSIDAELSTFEARWSE